MRNATTIKAIAATLSLVWAALLFSPSSTSLAAEMPGPDASAKEIHDYVWNALHSSDPLKAYEAGRDIRQALGARAIPAYIDILKKSDSARAAGISLEALAKLGPAAAEALPAVAVYWNATIGSVTNQTALVCINPNFALKELDGHAVNSDKFFPHLGYALIGPIAVPQLVEWSQSSDARLQRAAVTTLAVMGPPAAAAVPDLIPLLKHEDARVRFWAVRALGAIGPYAKAAVPALTRLRDGDPDEHVRESAGDALIEILEQTPIATISDALIKNARIEGIPASKVLTTLAERAARGTFGIYAHEKPRQGNDKLGQLKYIDALAAEYGPVAEPEAIPVLIRLMTTCDWIEFKERLFASRSLAHIGKPAVPALIDVIRDRDTGSAADAAASAASVPVFYAVQALGEIGPDAKPAIPLLMELAEKSPWKGLRIVAADALSRIDPDRFGKEQGGAIPAYQGPAAAHIEALAGDDPAASAAAAEALIAMGADGVPTLALALTDPRMAVRSKAANILGRIGAPAAEALPALVKTLKQTGQDGVVALARIDPEAAIPHLIDAFSDDGLAPYVPDAFSIIGPRAVAKLVEALATTDEARRRGILRSLALIGPPAADAVPAIVQLLNDPDPLTRSAAASSLAGIGPFAGAAVPQLLDVWRNDPGASVVASAAAALQAIGGAEEELAAARVDQLLADMKNGDASARERAIRAIGELGPSAKAAIPELEFALLDDAVAPDSFTALSRISDHPEQYVGLLTNRLKGNDDIAKIAPVLALGQPGAVGEAALPALKSIFPALKDRLLWVALFKSLGDIGPAARPVIDRGVLQHLRSSIYAANAGHDILVWMQYALAGTGDGDATPVEALVSMLGDDRKVDVIRDLFPPRNRDDTMIAIRTTIGAEALKALLRLGPKAEPALPTLIDLARPASKDRAMALTALEKIGPAAKGAVPVIVAAIEDRPQGDIAPECRVLGAIGAAAGDAVPVLIDALGRPSAGQRSAAADALRGIGAPAVPLLSAALNSDNAYVAFYAAEVLGDIGPAARPAIPNLQSLEREEDIPALRMVAHRAIDRIGIKDTTDE